MGEKSFAERVAEFEQSPEHQARIAARVNEDAALAQAHGNPTPGALGQAFSPEPLTLGPLTLQPLVGSHILILKQLDSPYYRLALESAKPKESQTPITCESEDVFEALFVMTRRPPELRAAFALGRQKFREIALQQTADVLSLEDMARAGDVVVENFARAGATKVEVTAANGTGAGDENFKRPPGSHETGSAGGCL